MSPLKISCNMMIPWKTRLSLILIQQASIIQELDTVLLYFTGQNPFCRKMTKIIHWDDKNYSKYFV